MKIHRPAIKTEKGIVVVAHKEGLKHVQIPAEGKRGFVTDTGKFVNRGEGAKIAQEAGQVTKGVKSLHSEDLPAYKRTHR